MNRKSIYSFFANIDEYHLYNYEGSEKNLLIISNLIYIILFLVLFIKINKNNKKDDSEDDSEVDQEIKKKDNKYKQIFILLIAAFISSYYHYNQCHNKDLLKYRSCYKIDLIMCFFIMIIIILNFKINSNIFILFIISLLLFCMVFTIKTYIYCHSLWHITTGLIIYLLLID
jgi:hypothetical protein